MKISLVFLTGRQVPHLEWALEGLCDQMVADDAVDIVVIDAFDRKPADFAAFDAITWRRITENFDVTIRVAPPKPNIWQGKYRVTSVDWWATANARNTGIVLAKHDYLVFLDDRSRLGKKWLDTVRRGYDERESVIAGSYDKLEGAFGAYRLSQDHRRDLCPSGNKGCGGGWMYGCTFALPLAWAIEVNGFEEGCDGLTGEDYTFGLMCGNNGHRIDFVPEMFVFQDRTVGNETCKGSYKCMDKGVSPNDKSHAALARFAGRTRTEFTPDLSELRLDIEAGLAFPTPDPETEWRDWYDGQLVVEM